MIHWGHTRVLAQGRGGIHLLPSTENLGVQLLVEVIARVDELVGAEVEGVAKVLVVG